MGVELGTVLTFDGELEPSDGEQEVTLIIYPLFGPRQNVVSETL